MSADALVSYAALILADAEVEISSDKLIAITKAAGSPVEQVWADVFAKALAGKDLKEILFNIGASGPRRRRPLPLLPLALPMPPLPRRLRRRRTSPMTTWASVSLTKRLFHEL
ncbi:ribosomal protein P1 [Yarrowia lipolytica]|uniref:60S acidic ribosomal protein P1 n=1 Tax=Yarrowia lipolytica TaxID=4952 RepID=A0A1D8N7J8_YARLL|nr:hypothetical protein YALI1_B16968g [Yarrowia lipolytica]